MLRLLSYANITAVALSLSGTAAAGVIEWLAEAENTAGNVTASTNGGSGWTLDGTAGVTYDFGALDALDGKAVDGSTVEFIFNLADNGSSISIGSLTAWSPGGERVQFKLEQWSNTGKFGITWEGFADYTLSTDSLFDEDVHVVFVRQNTGLIDMYVNGVFAETNTNKTNWRMDGGVGKIGSRSNGTTDVASGNFYGVASYDVALSGQEISDLYTAFVPEPSSLVLLGLGGLLVARRRRSQ